MLKNAIPFFHPNVCHICKKTSKDCKMLRCSQCQLISFCGVQHQKQDWKSHKEFCKVVSQVRKIPEVIKVSQNMSRFNKNIFQFRCFFASLCEKILKRKLDSIEMNMLHFQRSCSICYETAGLEDCSICLSNSLCSKHGSFAHRHKSDCGSLLFALQTHLYKSKDHLVPAIYLRPLLTSPHFFWNHTGPENEMNMDQYISKNVIIENHDESNLIQTALVADMLTRPLTVLHTLRHILRSTSDDLSIHIVGSTTFETETAHHWETILVGKKASTLHLHFIGPDVQDGMMPRFGPLTACSSEKFYHEFDGPPPDLIVAFNCGFHEFEGEDDTWGPSLGVILSHKVPVILTSYTMDEAVRDVARLKDLQSGLRVHQMENPFAGLSPFRDVETPGVYFDNKILSVIIPS